MNEQCVEGGSMNKKRLALLEKAFAAEINAAIEKHPLHLIQSNSKLAETMANEGYLARRTIVYRGAAIEGYELTHFGRLAYCMTCDDGEPEE